MENVFSSKSKKQNIHSIEINKKALTSIKNPELHSDLDPRPDLYSSWFGYSSYQETDLRFSYLLSCTD
jgi:hypothetical protein